MVGDRHGRDEIVQLNRTRITESPRKNLSHQHPNKHQKINTHILLMNLSLFTPLPLPPFGLSVHISFTFSSTILQCRSNALTRARSFLLLRQEMSTCECDRVAVSRIDSGPVVSSCSSTTATSYSLLASAHLRGTDEDCSPVDRTEKRRRGRRT